MQENNDDETTQQDWYFPFTKGESGRKNLNNWPKEGVRFLPGKGREGTFRNGG